MIKHKIILVPFPFDDFSGTKVRPAVCLTNEIGDHQHVIIAFISSQIPIKPNASDIVIKQKDSDFAKNWFGRKFCYQTTSYGNHS